jgi:hypothetical protein
MSKREDFMQDKSHPVSEVMLKIINLKDISHQEKNCLIGVEKEL